MKRGLENLLALVTLAVILYFGVTRIARLAEMIMSFPRRYIAMEELRVVVKRVVLLPDEPGARIEPESWLSSVLITGRKPASDPWGVSYAFFQPDGSARAYVPGPYDAFIVASAGADRTFGTEDDVLQAGGEVARMPRHLARSLEGAPPMGATALISSAATHAETSAATSIVTPAPPSGSGVVARLEEFGRVLREREPTAERKRYDPLARVRFFMN